ncbi:MAG: hypothetical protein K940chlam1_00936 [Candidatus Anoxychlamydiales bacterium]|nr:hypothetical protein [Candidatus Anoxychlamydiales bacterium]NGX35442.1 hypothetical protein [Candidatus Anoxychlamydiales bacterium]
MKKTIKKRKKAVRKTVRKTVKKAAKPSIRKRKKTARKPKKVWTAHVAKMQKDIDKALCILKKDIKRKAPFAVIEKDNNDLLMLLGECNYFVREFHEHVKSKK